VKVTGVSTFQIPGHALYIQDGNDGMRIQTSSVELVEPGRKVEAVGFPVMGEYAPILEDALVRVVGYANPITPLRVDPKDVISQQSGFNRIPYDQQLVQLQGNIVESHIQGGQRIWILRQGSQSFEAYLPLPAAAGPMPNIGNGSVLLLTGICTIHTDFDRNPISFGILLRSLKDIVILKQASWWTASHAVRVVVLLVILLLGMSGWLAVVRRQTALRVLTVTDPLTGLYNRRGFLLLAEQQWKLALRRKASFLLFYIDVDHFKDINDSLGHKEGDLALQTVAGVLRECFRTTDIIGRLGGDEFAVTALDAPQGSKAVLERRLATIVQHSNEKMDRAIRLSLSVGILSCDNSLEALSIEELLVRSDALMYQQKRERKDDMAKAGESSLSR
jgi:diguanylate cyclase (GGDEF)-like protein